MQEKNFFLTLMKIRLGLGEQDLSDRFKISVGSVSSIFNTWIRVMAKELKRLVQYPPKEHIRSNLPAEAECFPNLRCTIDCTEIFIERPRNLYLQAATWSDYKHHNTIKILVGITPRGAFSFVSKAWGGRASDIHIVKNSGFLELIDPFDELLADKGFTIANELTMRRAELVIPPGVCGREQLTPDEVERTKIVANFRIHVERMIGRFKEFQIVDNKYPINMLPVVNDVITTCVALSNLLPPLVGGKNLYE